MNNNNINNERKPLGMCSAPLFCISARLISFHYSLPEPPEMFSFVLLNLVGTAKSEKSWISSW